MSRRQAAVVARSTPWPASVPAAPSRVTPPSEARWWDPARSVGVGTVYALFPHAYDPWRRLAQMPWVTVEDLHVRGSERYQCSQFCDWDTCDFLGLCDFTTTTVYLCFGLDVGEARVTLAHELEHLDRGPVLEELDPHEERAVDAAVALRLIPSDVWPYLAQWVAHTGREEVIAALTIDDPTLATALRIASSGLLGRPAA